MIDFKRFSLEIMKKLRRRQRMSRLPIGTLLTCLSNDLADEPIDHKIFAGDLVVVTAQAGDKHYGDTTMLSLTTGVFYRAEYTSDCYYEAMTGCYEVYDPNGK